MVLEKNRSNWMSPIYYKNYIWQTCDYPWSIRAALAKKTFEQTNQEISDKMVSYFSSCISVFHAVLWNTFRVFLHFLHVLET
jgi:hypothetical protein